MKSLFILFTLLLTSCSTLTKHPEVRNDRSPAKEFSCSEMIKNFFKEKPEKSLEQILSEKKLLTFSEKKAQLNYPRLEWINRVKKSLNTSLRNWNNNRYPSFYLLSNEEIVPTSKIYAENLEKILANTVALDDQQITKAYVEVSEWKKSYINYKNELDQLIEERISLQFNISLLKKIKLDDEIKDVELIIKRGGVFQKEIVTLRKEDRNLKATINKLKQEMKGLDGSLFSNGRLKDRIIRQAMLQDMLTILHREMEYVVKNSPHPSEDFIKEFDQLSLLIKQQDFVPSTYGIYKIENKIFLKEVLTASKLDKVYAKIKAPVESIKNILANYFKNKTAGTDEQKVGFLKRIYAKITGISPKKAAIGGGVIAVAGIGYERYFAFTHEGATELLERSPVNEVDTDDSAHREQLDQTEQIEVEKHEAHSSVVEIHIDELTK